MREFGLLKVDSHLALVESMWLARRSLKEREEEVTLSYYDLCDEEHCENALNAETPHPRRWTESNSFAATISPKPSDSCRSKLEDLLSGDNKDAVDSAWMRTDLDDSVAAMVESPDLYSGTTPGAQDVTEPSRAHSEDSLHAEETTIIWEAVEQLQDDQEEPLQYQNRMAYETEVARLEDENELAREEIEQLTARLEAVQGLLREVVEQWPIPRGGGPRQTRRRSW